MESGEWLSFFLIDFFLRFKRVELDFDREFLSGVVVFYKGVDLL